MILTPSIKNILSFRKIVSRFVTWKETVRLSITACCFINLMYLIKDLVFATKLVPKLALKNVERTVRPPILLVLHFWETVKLMALNVNLFLSFSKL